MNVVSSLQNPVTRETTIKQIKEILQLGEKQISEDEMLKIITKNHEGKSIILKENQLNRMDELKSELLASNPDLYSI
jgi:C4-type Zn-finger protein